MLITVCYCLITCFCEYLLLCMHRHIERNITIWFHKSCKNRVYLWLVPTNMRIYIYWLCYVLGCSFSLYIFIWKFLLINNILFHTIVISFTTYQILFFHYFFFIFSFLYLLQTDETITSTVIVSGGSILTAI